MYIPIQFFVHRLYIQQNDYISKEHDSLLVKQMSQVNNKKRGKKQI